MSRSRSPMKTFTIRSQNIVFYLDKCKDNNSLEGKGAL